jgi:hypothetical protein
MFIQIIFFIFLILTVYYLGKSHCKQENISNEIKEIKYVKDKEIKILSRPNANRDDLLKLMYDNRL